MESIIGRAVVAGAAGTLALEATTYLDVAVRGRAPSEVPGRVVGRLASRAGIDAIAESRDDDNARNRRTGIAAILGYATGLGAATAATLAWSARRSVPLPAVALATGAAAMAMSDAGATALGVTDPRSWGVKGWIADVIPHLVFGFATATVLARTAPATAKRR